MGRKHRHRPAHGRERSVSATTAARTLGALIDRVRAHRVPYIVERAGTPVAQIVPIREKRRTLADLGALKSIPAPDDAFLEAVADGQAFFNHPTVPAAPGDRWER